MNTQLEKALALSQKTGDRLIILDRQNEGSAFVVMSLDDYEKLAKTKKSLVSLTEDELLDKINRDIALWQEEQVLREDATEQAESFFAGNSPKMSKFGSEPGPRRNHEYPFWDERAMRGDSRSKRKNWQIPVDRKAAAEEVIEEDRQYLEDVIY